MSAELRSNPDVRDGFKTIHFVQSIKTLLYWYGFSRVMAKSKNPIYVVRRTFHTFMEPENAYQSNQPCYKIRGIKQDLTRCQSLQNSCNQLVKLRFFSILICRGNIPPVYCNKTTF